LTELRRGNGCLNFSENSATERKYASRRHSDMTIWQTNRLCCRIS
jgi:hypothetical protein